MRVSITRIAENTFKADGANGSITIVPKEFNALEYFLSGLLTCSGTDIVAMAQKNNTTLFSFSMEADMVRNEDFPKKFNAGTITYTLECNVDETTVKHWVMASVQTYCSTINTLRNSVDLSYSIILNGVTIADKTPIEKIGTVYTADGVGSCCS